MSSSVHIQHLPSIKMVLHAAKHPESAVNGVVLCQQQDGLRVVITDYIPFFHSPLTLAPMLEVALHQTESYCNANNLRICGYFQSNEHVHDNTPTPFACKIADKIHEKSGPACLIMLRNDRLYPPTNNCFSIYTLSQDKWCETKCTVDTNFESSLTDLLKTDVSREICDFDDHLNDVRSDYLNLKLTGRISVTSRD
ncbi:ER membrane protein complex subunit 8 [Fasciola hepatica]|uniref:ER membrane protein complex subunit 8 n=1 Tax=Fasciola hepatica TaxID=6192 RepID=A0A4E0R6B9_FASHE|nr:ER membrane protein complex subunit 8 [Fasciola hepatica]